MLFNNRLSNSGARKYAIENTKAKRYSMTIQNYSQAAENNRAPIMEQLTILFDREGVVLEIGSGSGQHALAFSKHLPHLTW